MALRWMVALDGSEGGHEAFRSALQLMDKRRDELYIITAVQMVSGSRLTFERYNKEIEEVHKDYLVDYGNRADGAGVQFYKAILARQEHLCKVVLC